jgi:hypothetical protein
MTTFYFDRKGPYEVLPGGVHTRRPGDDPAPERRSPQRPVRLWKHDPVDTPAPAPKRSSAIDSGNVPRGPHVVEHGETLSQNLGGGLPEAPSMPGYPGGKSSRV